MVSIVEDEPVPSISKKDEIYSDEDKIPLASFLKHETKPKPKNVQRMTWKKVMCNFNGPHFSSEPDIDTSLEREHFEVQDYISIYFSEDDFINISECTNVKYMLMHGKPMNLTAKDTRVESIVTVMSRDRYFSIRNHLKVIVDGDISDNLRKQDKLWS
ncbi:hypothetical protein ILUMI_27368 [Ignelater luminosus]|uniref:Uncharacterized protein n=1 Tax=Ignelater luminosus TaxID=2038154 RepID=A0A8K0FWY5_IGNLU|nr:hypothetical protein ILUMI_27368 [Ignelater luminosus]